MIRIGRNLIGARGLLTALAVLSLFPAGCNNTQSSQAALDVAIKGAPIAESDSR